MNPAGNPSLMSQLSQSMVQGLPPQSVQTPGSPGFDPSTQPVVSPQMPQGSPASLMPSPGQMQQPQAAQQVTLPIEDQNPQTPGTQVSITEAEKIISALEGRLKNIGSVEKMTAQAALPPQPVA